MAHASKDALLNRIFFKFIIYLLLILLLIEVLEILLIRKPHASAAALNKR